MTNRAIDHGWPNPTFLDPAGKGIGGRDRRQHGNSNTAVGNLQGLTPGDTAQMRRQILFQLPNAN